MREPKLVAVVGRKGVGKSYTTTEVIKVYANGNEINNVDPRRVLILDVNDEYSEFKALQIKDIRKFSRHPKIEIRRIRPFMPNGMKMDFRQIQQALFKILKEYRNGLLLIEDINKYISDALPNDLIGAICTNRHHDLDIIMHFQSIGRISPKIWQNINALRFHKNTDSVDRHKTKFEDKYEYLKIAEIIINKKYYAGDKRYYLYVDIDDEKIRGNVTKADAYIAIEEYISSYYRQIITPLINQPDLKTGERKFTSQSAVEHIKQRIFSQHF